MSRRLAPALAVGATLVRPAAGAARGVRRALGALPDTDFDSPQWHDGEFANRLPARVVVPGGQGSIALEFLRKGRRGRPGRELPLVTPQLPAQAADLAATWLGHATTLLEVGGHWVLTDPVWSERVSPSRAVGPRRHHPVPLALADLPVLAAVLISHDHYDHLDVATIDRLVTQQDAPFVVPLGVGSHLRSWGVPDDRIVELDWGDTHRSGDLALTCTEARHFSGRTLTVRNRTLWSSWLVEAGRAGDRRRVFFGGDTGYTPAFADLVGRHGPSDLTVLPIGAYDARWSDIHMDPAEAVQAHLDVHGGVLLPIHWATFDLAFHAWSEPAEWLLREAAGRDVTVALPRPGERFVLAGDGAGGVPAQPWWR